MDAINTFLFGIYPYIAGSVFLVGSVVRFDYNPYTWKSGSSQFLRKRTMVFASNAFHIGVLALFLGHFVGLLTPHEVYESAGLSAGAKQILAVTAGGIFGTICLFGIVPLVYRRLTDPRVRSTSSTMDTFILLLLAVQLCLGLYSIPTSAHHTDGALMLVLADWAQRVVTFRGGAADLVAHVPLVYRAHLAVGLTMFLLFPFSRLVHIWSAPIWYLGRSYQLVRRRSF